MNTSPVVNAVAWFTVLTLVIYVPLETWASLADGLLSPFYLVDVVAMVLMAWGAVAALYWRVASAPAILCAAYAWASANGWRATASRLDLLQSGGALKLGAIELWVVAGSTMITILLLIALLVSISRNANSGDER